MQRADQYAVFGHPIIQSQSPTIHTWFAIQTNQNLTYVAQDVDREHFAHHLRGFMKGGGKGINCTIPLKEMAYSIADSLSPRAEQCKAVNTLSFNEHGQIHGDNTDGAGFIRDLTRNLNIHITDKHVLILGAGGATRGIVTPILEEIPASLTIANRTPNKALELSIEFGTDAPVIGCGFDELEGQTYDLIINATSTSLTGEVPRIPANIIGQNACCYDLAYDKSKPTSFVEWACKSGAAISVDGIGMLIEQAAEAFFIWRGIRPETAQIIKKLKQGRT